MRSGGRPRAQEAKCSPFCERRGGERRVEDSVVDAEVRSSSEERTDEEGELGVSGEHGGLLGANQRRRSNAGREAPESRGEERRDWPAGSR